MMNEAKTLVQSNTESKSTYSLTPWRFSPLGPKESTGILKYCANLVSMPHVTPVMAVFDPKTLSAQDLKANTNERLGLAPKHPFSIQTKLFLVGAGSAIRHFGQRHLQPAELDF